MRKTLSKLKEKLTNTTKKDGKDKQPEASSSTERKSFDAAQHPSPGASGRPDLKAYPSAVAALFDINKQVMDKGKLDGERDSQNASNAGDSMEPKTSEHENTFKTARAKEEGEAAMWMQAPASKRQETRERQIKADEARVQAEEKKELEEAQKKNTQIHEWLQALNTSDDQQTKVTQRVAKLGDIFEE